MHKNKLIKIVPPAIVGTTIISALSLMPAHSCVFNQYSVFLGIDGDYSISNPLDTVENRCSPTQRAH